MRPTLYMTMGYPGSGKTHFGQLFAKRFHIFHLNTDKLRLDMFDHPTYLKEEHAQVFDVMDSITDSLLEQGFSVYYDANMNQRMHRDEKRAIAERHGAKVELLWFQVPKGLALDRINNRQHQDARYFRNIPVEIFNQLKDELEDPIDEEYRIIHGNLPFEEQITEASLSKLI